MTDSLSIFDDILLIIGSAAYLWTHWLYSSQYIKTSLILPSLFKIASILLRSKQANEIDLNVKDAQNFIQLNKETDDVLKVEKERIRVVKRNMLIADISLAFLVVLTFALFEYKGPTDYDDSTRKTIQSILIAVFSILFAAFALKIGRVIKAETGKEPKNGLIYLHVVNMIAFTIGGFFAAFMAYE